MRKDMVLNNTMTIAGWAIFPLSGLLSPSPLLPGHSMEMGIRMEGETESRTWDPGKDQLPEGGMRRG